MRVLIDQETKHHVLDKIERLNEWMNEKRSEGVKRYGWSSNCACHECGDTGVNPETDLPCWCEVGRAIGNRRERKQTWLNFVPTIHLNSRMSTHPVESARKTGEAWLNTELPKRRSLLITGPTGTGKTGLAISIAYEMHLEGVHVRFYSVTELLDSMRPGERQDGVKRDAATVMEKVLSTGLLVLDDLGAQKVTEWSGERIQAIIDGRHARKLPTIITTNLSGAELRHQYGERVYSRVIELYAVTPLVGEDLRTSNVVQFRPLQEVQ